MKSLFRSQPRWRKILLIASGLFLLYTLFGFLLLPRLIHDPLTETVAQLTHRPVTLAELKINPLALSTTLRGLEIGNEQQPLASFEEIYVNFSISSLWQRAYVFKAIRLQTPKVVIAIDHEGRFNFQEMISGDDSGKKSGPPPVVVIHSFEVLRGAIDFDDQSRAEPFHTNIATLDFTLHDFSTRRDEAGNYTLHVATDLGETLDWQGTLQATPFRSQGRLQLGAIRSETLWSLAGAGFKFDLDHGLIDLNAQYLVDLSGPQTQFQLSALGATLRDLQVTPHGSQAAVLVLPQLDLSNLNFDLAQRSVTVDAVTLKTMQLHGVRQADGQLDLQQLFASDAKPEASQEGAQKSDQEAPWQVKLAALQLQEAALTLDDRTTKPTAQWQLKPFNLALANIELGSDKPIDLKLDTVLNGAGSTELHGTLVQAPLSTHLDMNIAAFDLTALQPYLQRVAQLQLQQGALDVAGHLDFAMAGTEPEIGFNGSAKVQQLRSAGELDNAKFLSWQALAIDGLGYESRPAHLSIKTLALTEPYLRFMIDPDGTTNLSHILAAPADSPPAPSKERATAEPATPLLVTIDRIKVAKGELNFSDQSIKPGFSSGIQQLGGTIRGLSSKELARADVDLKGKVDRYAPATISGTINPLSEDAFTDLKLDFHGIEMSSFSSYSGKFAGYKIDKGKLNVELHYRLSQKKLRGDNKIVIDQLQLGDEVDSPDATGLPVRLAIAILKDASGVIDLDLPVRGRIDDPDFHYGRVVWMALRNVIIKVAASPFKALAALMGGSGEEANQVSFVPGVALLSETEQTKLANLARALSQRPALLLEVRGTASAADRAAIAAAALEQRLATQPGESRQQRLSALYLKVYGKAAASLLPPPAKGEERTLEQSQAEVAVAAERGLLESMTPSDDALRQLAQERARNIVAALTEGDTAISAERIFQLDAEVESQGGERVVVPLSLKAR